MKKSISTSMQIKLSPICSDVCLSGNKVLVGCSDHSNVNVLTFDNSENAKDAFCAILFALDNESTVLEIIESKNSIQFKC